MTIAEGSPAPDFSLRSDTGETVTLEGLRGKYVQILKDGFPLFGGLSQNLSIAQIPPMDLKQIEIIKGPASTL